SAWALAIDAATWVIRRSRPVETTNPAQEQIILGVENVHAGVPCFREVVPLIFLVNPADIETERIARHKDSADEFEVSFQIVRVVLALPAIVVSIIPVLFGACSNRQNEREN